MITEADKKTIRDIAKKYHVKRVLLFGSCLCPDKENNDIDIAIEGISSQNFYKFYGDLLFAFIHNSLFYFFRDRKNEATL